MNNSIIRLQKEYKQYLKEPNHYYSICPNPDNFYIWDILLFGPQETLFEGGIFKCQIIFPNDYPNKPPDFKFITNIPHPNIYTSGKVCISILRTGVDQFGYEHISERWNPSHNVNSVLISILNVLLEPNLESPANIDIGKLWRDDFSSYKKMIYNIIANN